MPRLFYLLSAIILTVPLFVSKVFLYPYVHGKTVAVMLLAHLVIGLFLLRRYQRKSKAIERTPLFWAMIIFLTTTFFVSLFGVNIEKSIWGSFPRLLGLYHLTIIFFVAIILATVFKKEDWLRLMRYGLLVSVIVSVIAILQKFFPWFVWHGSRVGSTLDNPSFLAGYLIFFIFWGLILGARESIVSHRYLMLAATAINIMALVLTKTRGALLGLVAGFLVTALFLIFKKESRKTGLIFLGLIGTVVVAAILLDRHRIIINHLSDSTTVSRLMIWQIAGNGFLKHPFFGWGLENFNAPFNVFYNPNLLAFSFGETFADKAHNLFFEMLATTGLVGFLAYSGIFVAAFYVIQKLFKRNHLSLLERSLLAGLFVAYAVSLNFLFDQLFTMVLFALTLGYLAGLYQTERQPTTLRPALLGLGLLLVIVSGWLGAIKPAVASLQVNRAVLIFQADPDRGFDYFAQANRWSGPWYLDILAEKAGAIHQYMLAEPPKKRLPAEAVKLTFADLEQAWQKYTYDIRLPIFLGYLGNQLGLSEEKYLARANDLLQKTLTKMHPGRQQVAYILIENLLLQNKPTEAVAVARDILAQAPRVADSHYHLGNALLVADQVAEGLTEIKEAERLGYPAVGAKPLVLLAARAIDRALWSKAIFYINQAIEIETNNAKLFAQLAALYQKIGDFKKARQAVEKAVQLNPSLKKEADQFLKSLK